MTRLLLALLALIAVRAEAFIGPLSEVSTTFPKSLCSATPSYCGSDSDCPGGETCSNHDALLSAPFRTQWAKIKEELESLKAGSVAGPASATDNAIPVFDGTTGKLVKNSACRVGTAGSLSCTNTSGTAFSITQSASSQILSTLSSSGFGLVVDQNGRMQVESTGSIAHSILSAGSGDVLEVLDPDGDGWRFGADGALSSVSGSFSVATKNYLVDGPGNYQVAIARTFTPDSSGDDQNDVYNALNLNGVRFDVANADGTIVFPSTTTSARYHVIGFNGVMQATGASGALKKVLGGSSGYVGIDGLLDVNVDQIATNTGQLFGQINEIRFTSTSSGAFTSGGASPITFHQIHPLGMSTSGSGRTSGYAVFTGLGFYGNDSQTAGPIRVLSTDYVNTIFQAPVEGPSGATLSDDTKNMPLFIANKTGYVPVGRTIHGPKMTIGHSGGDYSDPNTLMTSWLSLIPSKGQDAVFNVLDGSFSATTSSTLLAHLYDNRSSSTSSLSKLIFHSEASGTWSGASDEVIAIKGTAVGATHASGLNTAVLGVGDIATQETTGGARLTRHPKMTSLDVSTCVGAGTCSWSNAIPDGATVLGVTARVTTAVASCSSLKIGDGSDDDMWGGGIAVAANTTTSSADYTAAGAVGLRTSATSIVVTCTGSTFSTGVIRLTLFYDYDTAATA